MLGKHGCHKFLLGDIIEIGAVEEPVCLFLQRSSHLGVRMAQVAHGNACNHVQVLLAGIVKERQPLPLTIFTGCLA